MFYICLLREHFKNEFASDVYTKAQSYRGLVVRHE